MRVQVSKHHKWKKEPAQEDLNIHGKVKKGVVSFQCEERLWKDFDYKVEELYGKYKKSLVLESLIKQFLHKNKNVKELPHRY